MVVDVVVVLELEVVVVVVVLLVPPERGAQVAPRAEAFLKISDELPLVISKVVAAADPICTVAL